MCAAALGTISSPADFTPPRRDGDISSGSRSSCAYGDTISGKYHLETILAEGRNGRIWYAHDQILGRGVAIKVAGDQKNPSDDALQLLLEGKAVAALNHPSIVEVLDWGMIDGREAFVVMELWKAMICATEFATRAACPRLTQYERCFRFSTRSGTPIRAGSFTST